MSTSDTINEIVGTRLVAFGRMTNSCHSPYMYLLNIKWRCLLNTFVWHIANCKSPIGELPEYYDTQYRINLTSILEVTKTYLGVWQMLCLTATAMLPIFWCLHHFQLSHSMFFHQDIGSRPNNVIGVVTRWKSLSRQWSSFMSLAGLWMDARLPVNLVYDGPTFSMHFGVLTRSCWNTEFATRIENFGGKINIQGRNK